MLPAPMIPILMFALVLFGILFKLRERGIHLIPRVRVRYPHIHLRVEPAWIIQARRSDRDKLRGSVGFAHDGRAAVRAKTSASHATRLTRRGMEAQRALQKIEGFRRHDDKRRKRASAGSLAIPAMTVNHHHWFSSGFVTNRAASASAGEGCGN